MSPPMWLPLVTMLAMRSVDTEDPFSQKMLIGAFVISHAVILALALKIRFSITAAGDKTQVSYKLQKPAFGADNTPDEVVTTTAEGYDLSQLRELMLMKIGIGVVILVFIYWKWQIIIPFAFQTVMNPFQLYQSPLFKIWVLGHEAKGELKRPWPVPENVPGWLKGMTGQPVAEANKKKN